MGTTWAFLIGRVVVGAYFLSAGIHHFTAVSELAGYAAAKRVPFPEVAVLGSGVLLVCAGLSFVLGVVPKLGVLAAVAFLLPTTLVMHRFWNEAAPAARAAEMINFTKNFALLGSSLMFLAIPEPWPVSLPSRQKVRVRRRAPA